MNSIVHWGLIGLQLTLFLFTLLYLFISFFVTALDAVAILPTCYSSIVTLAVLFLALRFFTITTAIYVSIWNVSFQFQLIFSLFNQVPVSLLVIAPITSALRGTHFSCWKTLTIHLETVCLFTSATVFWVFFLFICHLEWLILLDLQLLFVD
jgi:hypothetical protein